MILDCDSTKQEMFLNYNFDSINIKNFSVINREGDIKRIIGKTYLFSTFSPFGHSLLDIYGQYKVLRLKYPDIKPFFFEDTSKGYLHNYKISTDLINDLGCNPDDINDISKNNYIFDEVILFFDMTNTFPENFYQSFGINRSSHYFPFCSCYMGTENCGEGEFFKYNYLAIDLIVKNFSHMLSKDKTKKYFISRKRYNDQYKKEIDFFSSKGSLSVEEDQQFYRAKVRYCKDEDEIEKVFVENGYLVVYPEDYTLFDQIKMFSNAKDIASVSGASLFNFLWCDSNSIITEVLSVPGYRYHYKQFAEHIKVKHRYIDLINIKKELSISDVVKIELNGII
jgi:hypothetical protein